MTEKEIISFCVDVGLMHVCAECENLINQEKCHFYEKATNANRCMYLKFDEFCDCLKAILNDSNNLQDEK